MTRISENFETIALSNISRGTTIKLKGYVIRSLVFPNVVKDNYGEVRRFTTRHRYEDIQEHLEDAWMLL